MSKYYRDYVWKEGIPYGIDPLPENAEMSYKIAMDPYRKRISIEKYKKGNFSEIVYDSALLDFRHLKSAEQTAWQKVIYDEKPDQIISHIRNQDDRLVFIETYRFEKDFCKECFAKSPHNVPISHQKMYYTSLQDAFNGVVLFDNNNHPVMFKEYQVDEGTGEFTELLEEQWDMIRCTALNIDTIGNSEFRIQNSE